MTKRLMTELAKQVIFTNVTLLKKIFLNSLFFCLYTLIFK